MPCTSGDDDPELVERYRQGDREAFTALVVRYQRPVYNAAYWITRNAEDAADISQTVFLKAAEHIDDYDPSYRFFSWIYRIAVNESLNHQRGRSREDPLDESVDLPDETDDGPEDRLDAAQRTALLRRALLRLSVNDRLVITLRHFAEMSYGEIADVAGLDEKTVKSRLFEARQRLKALLSEPGRARHD